ncbi:outer membrane protein OmpH [mine drainage metagenome]|uniref:Outer membrane chaperone Skp (OmpH) n=1 Tax=mine drainage metagenome TaxID=410659 RepID=T0ZDB3_9ZZZZ
MRNFFFLLTMTLCGLLPCLTGVASAQPERIGVVDLAYVIAHSTAGKAAAHELKAYVQAQSAAFKRAEQRLTEERTLLQKNLPHETKAQQKKDIAAFQHGELALRATYLKTHNRITAKRDALLNPIQHKLVGLIRHYAKTHEFAIIFDTGAGTIYATRADILTAAILKALNASGKGS